MSFPNLPVPEEEAELQPAPPLVLPEIDYAVRLSEREAHDLGQRVLRELNAYEAAVSRHKQNAQEWRDDFELIPANNEGPWENSADLRFPATNVACSSHATRLNGQFLTVNPLFAAKAREPRAAEWTQAVEELLASRMLEGGIAEAMRECHSELTVVADPLVRTMWVKETRRRPVHTLEFDEEAFERAADAGVEGPDAFRYGLETNAKGELKYRLEFREEPARDGLEYRVIPFEESIVLPPTARRDEDLWGIGEYLWLRGLELEQGAAAGRYRKAEVKKLLASAQQGQRSDTDQRRDDHSGIEVSDYSPDDARFTDYRCVMLDWYDDLNRDGHCEWYWLLVECETGLVLQVLYSPYEHAESRYTRFPYLTRTAQLFSASIAERLATLNDAGTTALNDLLNICDQIVGLAGNFFYDSRSMLTPEKITLAPGVPQFVPGSVEGIRSMSEHMAPLAPAMQALLLVLEKVKEYADLVSATSNPSLGRETSGDKTLGEVRLVLGNAQQIFSDLAHGVALRWARVCDHSRWLVAQYGSENGVVRYLKHAEAGATAQAAPDPLQALMGGGEQPAAGPTVTVWQPDPTTGQPVQQEVPGSIASGAVPVEVLTAKIDFEPLGLSGLPDAASRVQRDLLMMDAALRNPVVGQMPDVLAEMYKQALQDSDYPNHDALRARIDAGIQAMQQAMQIQQALALQQGVVAGEQAAAEGDRVEREEGRQQADHEDRRASAALAREKGELEMLGAVPNPNGAPKGRK